MTRVLRIDRGELSPPERMDNGWLRVDGKIARVGIQEYEDAAGKMHRELRIPEEVFDAASLRSFELVPVTNTHPPVLLDDRNCRTFQVGQTGQAHRQDGDFVVATMMLTDADAILSAQAGRTQLSNGYTCELDPTQDAELVKKWGTYDFLQRKIRGNHIALVDAARAGPEARIRLDKAGNAVVASPGQRSPAQERIPMKTITLDGIVIDTEAADAQSVINRTLEAMKKRADDALSAERSRATGAEKKLAVVKDNAKYLVAKVGGIRLVWDAMKARMATCEECDGSGKVMDDGGKEAVCGYCDGKGSYRMHDMVKAAAAEGDDPDDDDDLDDAMEEAVEGAESTDEDELEVEQATEEGAGKAAKKADAAGREKRRREQARKDAARDRELLRKKRSDSRDRQIRRSMERRLDLEMNARRYLDEEDITAADLRKLDDAGVMKAIVKKLAPESKLDGKSAVEIRARYDAEVERAPAFTVDSARDMAMRSLPVIGAAGGNGQRTDGRPKDPRAAYLKRLDEQAKGKGKQATGAK